jgi:hypothetical protein
MEIRAIPLRWESLYSMRTYWRTDMTKLLADVPFAKASERYVWKSCEKFQTCLQPDKNVEHFTWRCKYVLLLPIALNRHKTLSSSEIVSGCYDSRGGTHTTRKRQNLSLNIYCPSCFLIGNWIRISEQRDIVIGNICCRSVLLKCDAVLTDCYRRFGEARCFHNSGYSKKNKLRRTVSALLLVNTTSYFERRQFSSPSL